MVRPRKDVPPEAVEEASRAGTDVKAVAAKYGVNYRSLYRRVSERQAKDPLKPDAVLPGAAAPPNGSAAQGAAPERPRDAGGGADAAMAAAGVKAGGGGGGKEGGTPPPPPIDPKAVVALAEMVTSITVKVACIGWGIEVRPEIEKLGALTASERSQLEMLAPYAAPYIQKILANMDKVGAALFAGAYVMMLARRMSELKRLRPEKTPAGEPAKPAPAPAPAPAVRPHAPAGDTEIVGNVKAFEILRSMAPRG